jgi:hypothetical protein
MAGLAKGGKGGGSYSPPAAAPAVAQNVSVDRDPDSDVAKLASNAKKRGWWWTQTQERKSSGASGKTLGTGL